MMTVFATLPEPLQSWLRDTFSVVSSPNSRTWWPALVAALLIALIFEKRSNRLRPSSWLLFNLVKHPSARADLGFVLIRSGLRVFVIAALPISAHILAVRVILFIYDIHGPPPDSFKDAQLIVPYSCLLFLISDSSRYVVHRFMHQIPALWSFHKVHHSAEVLTPLSLYRIHPLEQLLQAIRGVIVVGTVAGFFGWLSFGQANIWVLYGVPGVMFLFNVLGANLRHSHVWIRYPRLIEHFFISPAQHQLHHDVQRDRQMSNFGSVLAIWDWAGNSLMISHKDGQPDHFGLLKEDQNHDPHRVVSALLGPFLYLFGSTESRDRP